MHPFHSPFGLREHAPRPETRVDAVPLVSALLLALLLALAGSRFIFAPGLTVDIRAGAGDGGGVTLNLPRALDSAPPLPGVATAATLTVPAQVVGGGASATPTIPITPIVPSASSAATSAASANASPAAQPALLTARSDKMVFFGGRMFPQDDAALRVALRKAALASGDPAPVLLLKMDRAVSVSRFFQLKDYAEAAGFAKIQIAGEDKRSPRQTNEPAQ
jgi:biopolymer transport protein ExbD